MKQVSDSTLHFYQGNRLQVTLGNISSRSILGTDTHLLVELQRRGQQQCALLLASDIQGSVMQTQAQAARTSQSYAPFGHHLSAEEPAAMLAFTGQRQDTQTGCYLLGNGYRAYNCGLMRFASPDNMSPFSAGGINAYVYCGDDPINRIDPSGHMFRGLRRSSSSGDLPLFTGLQRRQRLTSAGLSVDSLSQSSRSSSPLFDPDSPLSSRASHGSQSLPGTSRASSAGPSISRIASPTDQTASDRPPSLRSGSSSSLHSSQLMEHGSDISAYSNESVQVYMQRHSGLAPDREIQLRFENPDLSYAQPDYSHLNAYDRANLIRRNNAERLVLLKR